ncbi:LysE family translocator [Sulfurospirillum halorespirans]|uniref:Putative threonine transporter RhtB-like n=1 Tax=Sulfurospirillum halorespirans DSM 13726 TaxID=1193502 RepID=A0A1D7TNC0_9BACT|nr:LysE family translocator [Sulfurospirillum halorespirans]AOO66487.1 putative threonine transporter RhtB-like [Sulfurospirillum halorespirans DSM 13726]
MEVVTLVFLLTSAVVILTPGQDMILVMSRSIAQGQKAGITTALGVSVGLLGHTLLATLGLGALLLASEFLFSIVKFIGAGYLIYIGYQLLRSKDHTIAMKDLPKVSYKKMFIQGALSNIMNPKVAIFYFSYLPQFVIQNNGNETMQLFILGFTFATLTFLIKAPIGFISGLLSFWIKTRPMILHYIHRTSGLILIGLGLKLALAERQ